MRKTENIRKGISGEREPDCPRDVEAKRPAEIDAFSGAILRKAAKAGIPVPVMERYHRELEEIIKSYS